MFLHIFCDFCTFSAIHMTLVFIADPRIRVSIIDYFWQILKKRQNWLFLAKSNVKKMSRKRCKIIFFFGFYRLLRAIIAPCILLHSFLSFANFFGLSTPSIRKFWLGRLSTFFSTCPVVFFIFKFPVQCILHCATRSL